MRLLEQHNPRPSMWMVRMRILDGFARHPKNLRPWVWFPGSMPLAKDMRKLEYQGDKRVREIVELRWMRDKRMDETLPYTL